jgi:transporter family protein
MTLSGFLIRGVISAICLGLGTVFMRASLGAGASILLYMAIVGRRRCGPGTSRQSGARG